MVAPLCGRMAQLSLRSYLLRPIRQNAQKYMVIEAIVIQRDFFYIYESHLCCIAFLYYHVAMVNIMSKSILLTVVYLSLSYSILFIFIFMNKTLKYFIFNLFLNLCPLCSWNNIVLTAEGRQNEKKQCIRYLEQQYESLWHIIMYLWLTLRWM